MCVPGLLCQCRALTPPLELCSSHGSLTFRSVRPHLCCPSVHSRVTSHLHTHCVAFGVVLGQTGLFPSRTFLEPRQLCI